MRLLHASFTEVLDSEFQYEYLAVLDTPAYGIAITSPGLTVTTKRLDQSRHAQTGARGH
jgi:hypothetical protein